LWIFLKGACFSCTLGPSVSFMVLWFPSVLGSPSHVVFSAPGAFALGGVPSFYRSLVSSLVVCGSSFWASGFRIGSSIYFYPVDYLSCKSAYWFLSSELVVSPHCIEKFFFLFLVASTGLPLCINFSFLTLIVLLSIFPGRWPTRFFTQPHACPLLVVMFLCPFFVPPPVNLFRICFLHVLLLSVSSLLLIDFLPYYPGSSCLV